MAKQQILQKLKHSATYVLMNLGEASVVQSVLCSFEEIILSASIESTLIDSVGNNDSICSDRTCNWSCRCFYFNIKVTVSVVWVRTAHFL